MLASLARRKELMRPALTDLQEQNFDVAIVGGGINGASAAHHLATAGYKILLVDKADFGSGASSRSSRLLHCGLMYLAPYDSIGRILLHPGHLLHGMEMARFSMRGRDDFVKYFSNRLTPFQFYYPLSSDQPFSPPQVKLGFAILKNLYRGGQPLDYEYLDAKSAKNNPFLKRISDPDSLRGAIRLQEYKYDWPERIVMDYVLSAEALGAIVRNYTAVESIERESNHWKVGLRETTENHSDTATICATVILNLTGVWTDKVVRLSGQQTARRVGTTKGVHIAIKLDPEFRAMGFVAMQRDGKGPFFCVPWREMHYIGPTRTAFNADIEDVRPTEEDVAVLLDDTERLLPGLRLKRSQVLFAWAGVRPQTYDETHPLKAAHARKFHDFGSEALPNVFSLTSSPIMYQKQTGEEILALIQKRLPLRHAPASAGPMPQRTEREKDILVDPKRNVFALREIATRQHCITLSDILCRRLGACWNERMGLDIASEVAEIVAPTLGWTGERTRGEVDDYRAFIGRSFLGPFSER